MLMAERAAVSVTGSTPPRLETLGGSRKAGDGAACWAAAGSATVRAPASAATSADSDIVAGINVSLMPSGACGLGGGLRRVLRKHLGDGPTDSLAGVGRVTDRQAQHVGSLAPPNDPVGLRVDQIHDHGAIGVGLDAPLRGHGPRHSPAVGTPSPSAPPTPIRPGRVHLLM